MMMMMMMTLMRYDDDDDDDDGYLYYLIYSYIYIGERGLTFYIVISGETAVKKKGIGIVGHLGTYLRCLYQE